MPGGPTPAVGHDLLHRERNDPRSGCRPDPAHRPGQVVGHHGTHADPGGAKPGCPGAPRRPRSAGRARSAGPAGVTLTGGVPGDAPSAASPSGLCGDRPLDQVVVHRRDWPAAQVPFPGGDGAAPLERARPGDQALLDRAALTGQVAGGELASELRLDRGGAVRAPIRCATSQAPMTAVSVRDQRVHHLREGIACVERRRLAQDLVVLIRQLSSPVRPTPRRRPCDGTRPRCGPPPASADMMPKPWRRPPDRRLAFGRPRRRHDAIRSESPGVLIMLPPRRDPPQARRQPGGGRPGRFDFGHLDRPDMLCV